MSIKWKAFYLLILAACTFLACRFSPAYNSTLEPGLTLDLPYFVGPYSGIEQEVTQAERTILPPDTKFARKVYQTLLGKTINCQIVLSGASRRSIHRPEVCLPGQGWVISGSELISVPINDSEDLKVTLLTLSREVAMKDGSFATIKSLFAYWFVGKDRTTASHWSRIILSSWDLLTKNINHRWGYVIVSAPITKNANYEEELSTLSNFIAEISKRVKLDSISEL